MKKRYILTFLIPIILAAVIALILTPSAQDNFIKNLSKFDKLQYVYYDVKIKTPEATQKIEQYKAGEIYFAKYYISSEPLIVYDSKGKLRFGVNDLVVSSSSELSKSAKSVFWLDKLALENIDKKSIQRMKDSVPNVYSAKLNDGTEIEVTFDNSGLLSKILYKNISYLLQLLPLNPENTQAVGDVEIIISNYNYDAQIDDSYKIPSEQNAVPYKEFVQAIQDDYLDYDVSEDVFMQVKSALGIGENSFDNQEDEYSDEDEDTPEENDEVIQNKIDINEEEFQSQNGVLEKEVPPDFELME